MDLLQRSNARGSQHVTMRQSLILLYVLIGCLQFASAQSSRPIKIKPEASFHLEVKEPSDLAYNPAKNTLFVASDNGFIAEVNLEGQLIRISEQIGYDLEGVTLRDSTLVIVDEFTRLFAIYDIQFNRIRNVRLNYGGGRNKAFESIAWIPELKQFITMTEKDPVWVFLLDEALNIIDEFELPFKTRDVSGLCWYGGNLWILSDEDRTVYNVSYPSLQVQAAYRLPIINPEGLAFDAKGNMFICSDDMERLYRFNFSQLQP